MRNSEIIEELVSVILMQEKELNALQKRINQLKQYLAVYEEYIQGE